MLGSLFNQSSIIGGLKMISGEEVKNFYFKAREKELTEGLSALLLPEIRGAKILQYQDPLKPLLYTNITLEGIDEKQNIANIIGHINIHFNNVALWGVNYDGWRLNDASLTDFWKEGARKEYFSKNEWDWIVKSEDEDFVYEKKMCGVFRSFTASETIIGTTYKRIHSLYIEYRGRALVNLT